MLIGVLVEVVSVTAQVDKEETAMKVRCEMCFESSILRGRKGKDRGDVGI